jgi:uncharacterized protein with PIN domain
VIVIDTSALIAMLANERWARRVAMYSQVIDVTSARAERAADAYTRWGKASTAPR